MKIIPPLLIMGAYNEDWRMAKVIVNRLLQIIPTLFMVVTITFFATRVIPGDPVAAMIGDQYDIAKVEEYRERFGLNESIPVQYIRYLNDIFHGDFGESFYFNVPALEIISQRLPNTLILSISSLFIAIVIGTLFGILAAKNQGTNVDYSLTVLSLFGISAPVFWVAIMMVMLFSVQLGWLPSFGMAKMSDGFGIFIKHLILPSFCLSIIPMGTITRITRSSMIESLSSDSVRALRARGIGDHAIVFKHALKNALPPLVTVIGMLLANAFSGAVLTESIFSWPGVGTMTFSAIQNRDYSLIQAMVLVVAIAFVAINIITDLLYMMINPKVALDMKSGGKS